MTANPPQVTVPGNAVYTSANAVTSAATATTAAVAAASTAAGVVAGGGAGSTTSLIRSFGHTQVCPLTAVLLRHGSTGPGQRLRRWQA